MIKKLLIGASALALTTTVAHAQAANQIGASIAQADAVAPVTITTQVQVGARFDTLTGRPDKATDVTASTDSRHSNFNSTPLPRETPATVFSGIDSSIPTGAHDYDLANKATVDQNGDNNVVDINQASGNQGFAAVQQDQDGNEATIFQANPTGAVGRLDASNSNNLAYIQQQTGLAGSVNGNEASVHQYYVEQLNGINPTPEGAPNTLRQPNRAVVLQGENANGHFARASEATIRQIGAGNDGIIRQGSNNPTSNSEAHLQQRGFSNFSAIRQGSEAGDSADRYAAVFQQGERHTANVVQLGFGKTTADIVQDGGLRNQANLVQRGSSVEASILQRNGDYNATYVEQALGSDGSKATVEQNGGQKNYVDIIQSKNDSDAKVLQNGGDFNVAVIYQTSVANSNAYVDTNGSNNFVTIKQ